MLEALLDGKIALWQYRATFTFNATTTTTTCTITIRISPGVGNFFQLKSLLWGTNDYAADRLGYARGLDEDLAQSHGRLISLGTIDNEYVAWPWSEANTDTIMSTERDIVYAGDDILDQVMTGLRDGEAFTISLRAYIKGTPPTITVSGSAGITPATSTTVNRVVN